MAEEDAMELDCPLELPHEASMRRAFEFIVEGVLLCAVAVAGIASNSLGAYVLCARRDLRANLFNRLLVALVTADSAFLALSINNSFRRAFQMTSDLQTYLFPFAHSATHVVLSLSIYLTVALAVQRTVALRSAAAATFGAHSSSQWKQFLAYFLPALVLAVAVNLPVFFAIEIAHAGDGTPYLSVTNFRKSTGYVIYYNNWFRIIFVRTLPLLAVVACSVKVFLDVRAIRRSSEGTANEGRQGRETSFAVVLLAIVVVFVVCHFPGAALNMYEAINVESSRLCGEAGQRAFPSAFFVVIALNHFLLVVNSSANMLLYTVLNKRFRRHLAEFVCRNRETWTMDDDSSGGDRRDHVEMTTLFPANLESEVSTNNVR